MLKPTHSEPANRTSRGDSLTISDLHKSIAGQPVLRGIDLAVPGGQLLTVLGPSGSGKTTLLRLVCGFEAAEAGRIELGGCTLVDGRWRLAPERRGIGYVAQEGALFPHLDVRRNIEFGLSRAARRAVDVGELLAAVGLPANYARRAPSALSGGEQQRVALARALAPGPRMVLLDEPFSSLDAGLRAETRAAVAATLKATGTTAVLVTHDQGEALSMGDRLAVLLGGRIAQSGTPGNVYRDPLTRDVANFIGEAVQVAGEGCGDSVSCCFGRLPLAPHSRPSHGRVDVLIRPEQFCIAKIAHTDATDTPSARVENICFYGHDARVDLKTADDHRFQAVLNGFGLPAIGEDVAYEIAGPVHAFSKAAR